MEKICRASVMLNSFNFSNSPQGSTIFEPVQGRDYVVSKPFDFNALGGELKRLEVGARLKLVRIEVGCAHFELRVPSHANQQREERETESRRPRQRRGLYRERKPA